MTSPDTAPVEELAARVNATECDEGVKFKEKGDEQYQSQSEKKVQLNHYVRIFSFATRFDLCLLFFGSAASVGAGLTLPLMNIVFGNLVGSFNSYFTPGSSTSQRSFNASINSLTLDLVYLWIGKFILCYIAMFTFRITGIRISAAIRLAYVRAVFTQSVSVLDKLPPGQTATTITTKANLLQLGISEKLSVCLQSIALLVGAFAIAFKYSWRLTLATSSVLLFVLVVYGALVPFTIKLQKNKDHADEKSTSLASEVISSVRMVVACGAEMRVASRFGGWVEESRRRGLLLSPCLGIQLAPIFFSLFAGFGLSFWLGVRLYIQGDISSVSTVLIVLTSVLMSVMSLGRIVAPLIDVSKAAGAASTFFVMIDAFTTNSHGSTEPEASTENDIILEDVTFAYPSRPHVKVLDGVSMRFEKGKLTAIVGPSGSGKSTVIGLLELWYTLGTNGKTKDATATDCGLEDEKISDDDTSLPGLSNGSIHIGQHNINQLNFKWWRSQIGLVQQEPFIFNDTIYNNVSHGLVGSRFEKADDATRRRMVEQACKEANAEEFINRLPMGLETIVGDGGIKLSGGQRQRLAIARSIIKQPRILIFDEATSAIDVRGEKVVQEALDRVSKQRTTIMIAHRLATVRRADKIIVIAKGKVVEEGTHDELLSNQNGAYHALVSAQTLSLEPTGFHKPLACSSGSRLEKVTGIETCKREDTIQEPNITYRTKDFFSSLGIILVEQRSQLPWLILVLVGSLGAGVSLPVQSYIMAQIIVVFTLTGQALVAGSEHWSLMFLILAIGVAIAYFVLGYSSNSFGINVSCFYRNEILKNVVQQPISFFDAEDHSAGTLVSRISGDPIQLFEMMGPNMAFALSAIFSIIGCVSIAFAFGWKLTIVALFASMPVIIAASFQRIKYELVFEKMNAEVFAESSKFATEAIGAFRTVSSLTLEDLIHDRYSALLSAHVQAATKKARFSTLVFALSDSVNLLCISLTFYYGGRLLGSLEYSPVQFLVIYVAIIQGSESAGQWMSFGPNIAQATAAINRILSLRMKQSVGDTIALAPRSDDGGGEIEFRDVNFTYPTRDTPIFRRLDLTIQAGQFAAFVGASGCGKTTIVSLIEHFYTVQKGAIYLDGIDISKLDMNDYRQTISLVAQEPSLFQGTIKENVLLGVDENTVTEETLHQVCRDAEIHDFILSLPESYETDIGSRGVALSGGQKQRISIARALVRKPRILLLDEATSSLDSESEKLVQAAFERAGKGRSMIVVAHRISTISNADVIFVLGNAGEEGGASVLEKGTHRELLRAKGIYWQMCEGQALDK